MDKFVGIKGIIAFCSMLKESKIHFNLNMYSDDALTVTLTLVGARVEVEFQEEETSYSVFLGDEGVESDLHPLFEMIREHI